MSSVGAQRKSYAPGIQAMKAIGIAVAVVIVLAVILFIAKHRTRGARNQKPSYNVNLFVLLAEAKGFRPEDLIVAFKETWGIRICCNHHPRLGPKTATAIPYLVGDGPDKNNVVLTWSSEPLGRARADLLAMASQAGFADSRGISQADLDALRNHKAHFRVDYGHGPQDPKERMRFTARLLLALCRLHPVCGYVDSSAQAYRPLARLPDGILANTELTVADLFELFVNVQFVSDKGNVEIHTHGMDQFWLPDVQIICPEKDRSRDRDVLCNAAIYMIDRGRAMKVGDTSEQAGDGRKFRVESVKPAREHPFGVYGAIRLRSLEAR